MALRALWGPGKAADMVKKKKKKKSKFTNFYILFAKTPSSFHQFPNRASHTKRNRFSPRFIQKIILNHEGAWNKLPKLCDRLDEKIEILFFCPPPLKHAPKSFFSHFYSARKIKFDFLRCENNIFAAATNAIVYWKKNRPNEKFSSFSILLPCLFKRIPETFFTKKFSEVDLRGKIFNFEIKILSPEIENFSK